MKKLFDTGCRDEFGNPYMIPDRRKTCEVCGQKSYFVKRMPVDCEPNEDGGVTAFYGNACFDCVDNWDEIISKYY